MHTQRPQASAFLLMLLFFLGWNSPAIGQERINISAGIGFPELINVGARLQFEQKQLGLSIGGLLLNLPTDYVVTASGSFFFHFAGSSYYSDRRPWYGRIGPVYYQEENEYKKFQYLFFDLRFGRDINFSHTFGLRIDAGANLVLYKNEIEKKSINCVFCFDPIDFDTPILPSIGLELFYRFL